MVSPPRSSISYSVALPTLFQTRNHCLWSMGINRTRINKQSHVYTPETEATKIDTSMPECGVSSPMAVRVPEASFKAFGMFAKRNKKSANALYIDVPLSKRW